MKTYQLVALMSLPATAKRSKVARGETFEASEQERRDLLRDKRAEDAAAAGAPAVGSKAK